MGSALSVALIVMLGLIVITASVLAEVRAARLTREKTHDNARVWALQAKANADKIAELLAAADAGAAILESRLKALEKDQRERARGLRA